MPNRIIEYSIVQLILLIVSLLNLHQMWLMLSLLYLTLNIYLVILGGHFQISAY